MKNDLTHGSRQAPALVACVALAILAACSTSSEENVEPKPASAATPAATPRLLPRIAATPPPGAPTTSWQNYVNQGNQLYSQGRLEEAIGSYKRALELAPESAEAHSNLAQMYLAAGREEEARPHLEQAIRINPDLPAAQALLGQVLAGAGKIEEAEAHFRRALKSEPDSPEANQNLAVLLDSTGRSAEAIPF